MIDDVEAAEKAEKSFGLDRRDIAAHERVRLVGERRERVLDNLMKLGDDAPRGGEGRKL